MIYHSGHFEEPLARYYTKQLLCALAYMHQKGVAHRDIKLQNTLLSHDLNLLVADFGLSVKLSDGYLTDTSGTSSYLAPEKLYGLKY